MESVRDLLILQATLEEEILLIKLIIEACELEGLHNEAKDIQEQLWDAQYQLGEVKMKLAHLEKQDE